MDIQKVLAMDFAKIHSLYVQKAEKKGRTCDEVNQAACWLTGYGRDALQSRIDARVSLEAFFAEAPLVDERMGLVTGSVCGVRVEEVADPRMRAVRALDKLVDEIAKGKPMEKVLRS